MVSYIFHVRSTSSLIFPRNYPTKIQLPISNPIVAHLHVTNKFLAQSAIPSQTQTLPFEQADNL